ncbi:hypothetical protein C2E23DRAFT_619579 [Lenzites betulinus]|nr:hypothetical protein C2E23DRAFT_619579 [Lenzites betulinus]
MLRWYSKLFLARLFGGLRGEQTTEWFAFVSSNSPCAQAGACNQSVQCSSLRCTTGRAIWGFMHMIIYMLHSSKMLGCSNLEGKTQVLR